MMLLIKLKKGKEEKEERERETEEGERERETMITQRYDGVNFSLNIALVKFSFKIQI